MVMGERQSRRVQSSSRLSIQLTIAIAGRTHRIPVTKKYSR